MDHPSIHISLHPSIIHSSNYPSIFHLSVHQSIHPPSVLCLSIHPFIHTSIHHSSICTSIYPPSNHSSIIHPSIYIHTPICSSLHPSIHPPSNHSYIIYLSIHTYIFKHPFIHLSTHPPSNHSSVIHLSIHLPVYIHPSICLSVHPSIQPFVYHPCIYPSICLSLHSLFIQLSSTLQILVLSCPCFSVHSFPSALVLPYSGSPCLSSLESHSFPVSLPSFSRQRCCSPIQPTASFWPLTPVPLGALAPPHPPGPNPPTPRVSPFASGLLQAPHTSTGAGKSPHTLHCIPSSPCCGLFCSPELSRRKLLCPEISSAVLVLS